MVLFREQIESYKEKIGKGKAESTYRGLVADYKSLLLFMKTKKNIEDIAIDELEKSFIEDYYTWMLGTAGNANATAFNRVNTLKWPCTSRRKRVGCESILSHPSSASRNTRKGLFLLKRNYRESSTWS